MNTVDLRHLRRELCGVLPALRRMNAPLREAPPTVIASCIIIGHTSRREVEQILGEPWRPQQGAVVSVAHYVYPPSASRETLSSLFLEYDEQGIVRAFSAAIGSTATSTEDAGATA